MMRNIFLPGLILLGACNDPVVMDSYLAVLYISPTDGSINVPSDIIATATFSEDLDEDSITPLSVSIVAWDGEPVESELSYDASISTVFIAPIANLESNSEYEVVLDQGLIGVQSGALIHPISASFTTHDSQNSSDSENAVPIANAGDDQNVLVNDLVLLDGTFSTDDDEDPLTYAWEFIEIPADSLAEFNDSNSVTPQFTADVEGTFIVGLTVDDGIEASEVDYVQIFVTL